MGLRLLICYCEMLDWHALDVDAFPQAFFLCDPFQVLEEYAISIATNGVPASCTRCLSIAGIIRSCWAVWRPLIAIAIWSWRMWRKCGQRFVFLTLLHPIYVLWASHGYLPLLAQYLLVMKVCFCKCLCIYFVHCTVVLLGEKSSHVCRSQKLGKERKRPNLWTRTDSSARCSFVVTLSLLYLETQSDTLVCSALW